MENHRPCPWSGWSWYTVLGHTQLVHRDAGSYSWSSLLWDSSDEPLNRSTRRFKETRKKPNVLTQPSPGLPTIFHQMPNLPLKRTSCQSHNALFVFLGCINLELWRSREHLERASVKEMCHGATLIADMGFCVKQLNKDHILSISSTPTSHHISNWAKLTTLLMRKSIITYSWAFSPAILIMWQLWK